MYFSTLAVVATALFASAASAVPVSISESVSENITAIATITSTTNSSISGIITFTQVSIHQSTWIYVNVTGLPAGNHGIHVHQYGDLSNGCLSTGAHYNPHNHTHGGPDVKVRHVGDYGNLFASESGWATLNISSDSTELSGKFSFIGRAVVIHSVTDDLGLGVNAESLATGNSGTRIACGVIGYSST